jgi:hypothetical protein
MGRVVSFVPEVVQDTAGITPEEDVLTRRCSKQTSMVWDMSSQRHRLPAPLLLATLHNIRPRGRSVLCRRGRGRSECLTLCQSNEIVVKHIFSPLRTKLELLQVRIHRFALHLRLGQGILKPPCALPVLIRGRCDAERDFQSRDVILWVTSAYTWLYALGKASHLQLTRAPAFA